MEIRIPISIMIITNERKRFALLNEVKLNLICVNDSVFMQNVQRCNRASQSAFTTSDWHDHANNVDFSST